MGQLINKTVEAISGPKEVQGQKGTFHKYGLKIGETWYNIARDPSKTPPWKGMVIAYADVSDDQYRNLKGVKLAEGQTPPSQGSTSSNTGGNGKNGGYKTDEVTLGFSGRWAIMLLECNMRYNEELRGIPIVDQAKLIGPLTHYIKAGIDDPAKHKPLMERYCKLLFGKEAPKTTNNFEWLKLIGARKGRLKELTGSDDKYYELLKTYHVEHANLILDEKNQTEFRMDLDVAITELDTPGPGEPPDDDIPF